MQYTEMVQVTEIFFSETLNIMAGDDRVTQRARTSAIIMLT